MKQKCAWCSAPAEFRPVIVWLDDDRERREDRRSMGIAEHAVCLFHKGKVGIGLVRDANGEIVVDRFGHGTLMFKLKTDLHPEDRQIPEVLTFERHTSAKAKDVDVRWRASQR